MTTSRTRLALLALLAAAAPAAGQEAGWDGEAEAGASLLFGITEQTLLSTRIAAAHADSAWELGGDARYVYGTSTDADGEEHLSHRAGSISGTATRRPFARLALFGTAGAESSFQRRIDLRLHGGAGMKYTVLRTAVALAEASLALLGERTTFDENPADPDADLEETLARWALRAHGKRTVGEERIVLETEATWRPALDDMGDAVATSTTSATVRLSEALGLKLTLLDVYDSRAEDRGANSPHDGQFLVSLLGTF